MAETSLSGSLIRGYRIHEMIYRGTYATMYRATRQNLETEVSIKAIDIDAVNDPVFIKRFEREARLISRLKHPHITSLYDYWRDDYGAYIVMEFYAGGSLRTQLHKAPFSLEDTLRTLESCADALDYMHRNDVLHRDIKPDNILFDKQGNAYLGEFGIAKDLDDIESTLTAVGDVVGTAQYSSPEQLRAEKLSLQSDIFSLGVTLYEMLSGQHPFPNLSTAISALRILSDPLPKIASINDAMNDVIQKATAKNPSDRYASALEMAVAFREAVEGKASEPQIESLTPRELEVLQHLADGLNNAEIAEAMFIERPTVKWYLRQIYPKLGAENRAQAIVIAHQHDLIFRDIEPENDSKTTTAELLKTNLGRHNLPAETGEFVGRKDELLEIAEILDEPKNRLLTILAPGGMGKTSLAIEAARQQFDNFRDGVYFVELSALENPQQLSSAIADVLQFQFQKGTELLEQLLSYLQYKNLLLVLDSFEHLLAGSPIVSQILAKSPEIKIIVTSRERLNLRSEMVFSIFGLGSPKTQEKLEEQEAPNLLIQELRRSQPDFELNEETAPYIWRICKLVEGMPLALILASAWGDMLTVGEIANEIEKSLDFLSVEMPDIPQRHWDMRVVLKSTWERLSETERDAFMKMSIFYRGCSREAAEKVTGANLRTLMSLVNKSLLRRDKDTGRFSIHELLRQYAEEQLKESGQLSTVRDAHVDYYAEEMHKKENSLKGQEQIEALDDIEGDFENVRAAWLWAIDAVNEVALDAMCESLYLFSTVRNRLEEAQDLFEATEKIASQISQRIRGRLLTRSISHAELETSKEKLETALEIARQNDDKHELAIVLRFLADILPSMGEADNALKLAEESLQLSEAIGGIWEQASSKLQISFIYQTWLDLPEQAYRFKRESYELFKQIAYPSGIAITLNSMAISELYYGDVALAQSYLQDSLSWWRKIGQAHEWANTLSNLSRIAIYHGHFDKAEDYVREAYQIAIESGYRAAIILALASRSILLVMQEKFQDALEISNEMDALRQDSDNPHQFWYVDTNQGIALCGLERYKEAAFYIDRALAHGFELAQPQWIAWMLLGKSIIFAFQGQRERALEIYALNLTLPEVRFWHNKHPLALRLQAQLQAHFNEADYQTIWERGQAEADNWREMVQTIIDEIKIEQK